MGTWPVLMTDMECGTLEVADGGAETPLGWDDGTMAAGIGGK